MRVIAAALGLAVVLGYLSLMRAAPEAFGWTYPRGGIGILTLSLVAANVALWAAKHLELNLNQRFQLAVAAWIWLVVQAGCMAWLHASYT